MVDKKTFNPPKGVQYGTRLSPFHIQLPYGLTLWSDRLTALHSRRNAIIGIGSFHVPFSAVSDDRSNDSGGVAGSEDIGWHIATDH